MTPEFLCRELVEVIVFAFVLTGPAMPCLGQPVEVTCRAVWKAHQGPVHGLVPSVDGRTLVTTGWEDGTVKIWDMATGTVQRRFEQEIGKETAKIWDIVSATERRLVREVPATPWRFWADSRPKKRRLKQKNTKEDERPKPLKIRAVLLPDNQRILMMILDQSLSRVCPDEIVIYDLKHGNCDTIFSSGRRDTPDPNYLGRGKISEDHTQFAYWFSDNKHEANKTALNIYDCENHRVAARIDNEGLAFTNMSFSADGEIFATETATNFFTQNQNVLTGRITIWNARTGEKLARVGTDGRIVAQPLFSPNGRDLAILGGLDQNVVYICYLNTYQIVKTLNDFRDRPGQRHLAMSSIRYTPDGKFLIGQGSNGTVLFWETKDYREFLWARLYPGGGVAIMFTPDGKKMLSIGGTKEDRNAVKVWDTEQFLSLIKAGTNGRIGPGKGN